ncbi:unnamed protein product [Victoria cruziana]
MRRGKGKKTTGAADSASIPEWGVPMNGSHVDEVEELLRIAQDDVFLRLNVDSHRLHSSSGLDADLDRRFAALKTPSIQKPNPPAACNESEKARAQVRGEEPDNVLGADLSARFLALKGPTKGETSMLSKQPADSLSMAAAAAGCGEDEDFESEVQKLLEWAKDAARLDPSQSDEEEDDCSDGDDDYSDGLDDEIVESDDDRSKSKMKGKVGKKEKHKK